MPEPVHHEPAYDADHQRQPSRPMGRIGTVLLGLGLLTMGVLTLVLLVAIWPAVDAARRPNAGERQFAVAGTGMRLTLSPESTLLLLVILSSVLGGFVHAATSFSTYVGNRRLTGSWLWWYLLRVVIGAALAVLFYFALRGGLLSAQASSETVNPFGVAALSALVGLFSKQATDKLREVFETMFRTAPGYGDDEREGKAANPQPALLAIEPTRVPAGSDAIELTLEGVNFQADSVVEVSGPDRPAIAAVPRTVRYLGPTELKVVLRAEDLAHVGELVFTVVNPEPGGGRSNPRSVDVHDVTEAAHAP